MSTPSSVPYPPETWGIDLPESFGKKDIESLLQNILQTLSECISARSSETVSSAPYVTGANLIGATTTQQILQQYVTWTVPSGGGSTSASLLVNSPILPIQMYGMATITSPSITSYPLGYNVGTTTLSAYFSSNNVNITASASLAGYTVTVVVRYVYFLS
jgi:hypothetical protein